jgi:protein-disulfide isomerase
MTAQASNSPAGARAAGDGIMTGDGPVTVDAYVDYLCPYCRDFEISAGPALSSMVADGAITLVYHPMSFLDQASTTRYSSRAASAAGCAADQGKFLEYTHALFGSQPPEGGPGLDDAELIALGASAGLDEQAFGSCVRAGRYLDWQQQVTDAAITRGVSGTPTVLVDGSPVAPDAQSIAAGVSRAARG